MCSKPQRTWKVATVLVEKLEETLNQFEANDFAIEKVEMLHETYEGVKFIVVGFKPEAWD